MPSLSKADKAKQRVVFTITTVALLLQRACREAGLPDDRQPAIQQCTALISEIIDPLPEDIRNVLLFRVNRQRILLTDKVKDIDTGSALIAAIELMCGNTVFKSAPGSRFDFIRQTLRANLPVFRHSVPMSEENHRKFTAQFKIAIFK